LFAARRHVPVARVLLLVGVLILSGGDHAIEAWVNERLPDAWLAPTTRIYFTS
jgi:hypothetical protein